MSYKGDQTRIYNDALKNVTSAKRRIAENYLNSRENIKDKLAAFWAKKTAGVEFSKSEALRLQILYNEIGKELTTLGVKTTGIIAKGFEKNFSETYYKTGFITEREVNIGTAFVDNANGYDLNYVLLPTEAIEASLTEEIAGHTFKDRMLRNRRVLQWSVRTAVANALTEGLSAGQLAKNLGGIDKVFKSSRSKAMSTARTEMLRAYSIGQEEAIDLAKESGVEGDEVWSSTLDEKTRKKHRPMDGQKSVNGLFTFPDGVTTVAPRLSGVAGHDINCRGRKLYQPFGIKPTKRVAKMPNGEWEKVNGDITYDEYEKWVGGLDSPKKAKSTLKPKSKAKSKVKPKTRKPVSKETQEALTEFTRLDYGKVRHSQTITDEFNQKINKIENAPAFSDNAKKFHINKATEQYKIDLKNIPDEIKRNADLIENHIKLAAPHEGVVYRGIDGRRFRNIDEIFTEGNVVNMAGTSSWSQDLKIAKEFAGTTGENIIFKLTNESGVDISQYSIREIEKEIIQSKDSKFKVISRKKIGDTWNIELEETSG